MVANSMSQANAGSLMAIVFETRMGKLNGISGYPASARTIRTICLRGAQAPHEQRDVIRAAFRIEDTPPGVTLC